MSDESFSRSQRGSFIAFTLAAFVIVSAGIKLAAPILAPVVLGAYIATVNVPLVSWLRRQRLPLVLTVACALLADTVMLGGFTWLFVGALARLSEQLPIYVSRLQLAGEHLSVGLKQAGVSTTLQEMVDPASVLGMMAELAGNLAGGITDLVLALIIAAFLLFRFTQPGQGDSGTPMLRTENFRKAVREMYRYIAIKTVVSIATGVSIGLWHWTIGADLPVLFGLLAFLLNYIPTLGSVAVGVLATGVGLLQYGVEHALLVAVGYVVVNIAFGEVIEPRVMGRALGLWPLVVLLSVVFWSFLLGVIGALLSALLTQAVKLLLLATPDLRPVGLALGPKPTGPPKRESQHDLLEEAMPQSVRSRPPPS